MKVTIDVVPPENMSDAEYVDVLRGTEGVTSVAYHEAPAGLRACSLAEIEFSDAEALRAALGMDAEDFAELLED